eukprot:Opistho-2@60172
MGSSLLDRALPYWIGVVSVMALGNSVQCFLGHEWLVDKLYTLGSSQVTALSARTFGTWTGLASIVRIYAALDLHNKSLYDVTLLSFVLANAHFLGEVYVYKTAALELGVVLPLIISGTTMLWMLFARSRFVGVSSKRRD